TTAGLGLRQGSGQAPLYRIPAAAGGRSSEAAGYRGGARHGRPRTITGRRQSQGNVEPSLLGCGIAVNHRGLRSGGRGCPLVVRKGGGGGRGPTPGDMETKGHPRPPPLRRTSPHLSAKQRRFESISSPAPFRRTVQRECALSQNLRRNRGLWIKLEQVSQVLRKSLTCLMNFPPHDC